MISLAQIRAMNAEIAAEAAQAGLEPLIYWGPDDMRRIPNLGDHRPHGWRVTRVFFVDSSGMGQPDEPAYTYEELLDRAVEGRAYAIVEAGLFQVHVAEFVREGELADVDYSGRATFPPEGW